MALGRPDNSQNTRYTTPGVRRGCDGASPSLGQQSRVCRRRGRQRRRAEQTRGLRKGELAGARVTAKDASVSCTSALPALLLVWHKRCLYGRQHGFWKRCSVQPRTPASLSPRPPWQHGASSLHRYCHRWLLIILSLFFQVPCARHPEPDVRRCRMLRGSRWLRLAALLTAPRPQAGLGSHSGSSALLFPLLSSLLPLLPR